MRNLLLIEFLFFPFVLSQRFASLKERQDEILERINAIEGNDDSGGKGTSSSGQGEEEAPALAARLRELGAPNFMFKRVPSDYYERSLHERMELLEADSTEHLCKTVVRCPQEKKLLIGVFE